MKIIGTIFFAWIIIALLLTAIGSFTNELIFALGVSLLVSWLFAGTILIFIFIIILIRM